MRVNKAIRSGKKEVDEYISSLEDYLTSLEANNVYKMLKSIDENAGVIADDVVLLATEADDEKLEANLRLLGSKKNKRFDAFLALVKASKDFGNVSSMLKEFRLPEVLNEVEKPIKIEGVEKKIRNIQDLVTK